jgi:hypothetical protein
MYFQWIRLSFVKTSEFRGGVWTSQIPPLGTPLCTGIALPYLADRSQNGDGDDYDDTDEIKKGMVGKCISMQDLPYANRILIITTERKRPLHMSEDDIKCTLIVLIWIHVTQDKDNLPFLMVTLKNSWPSADWILWSKDLHSHSLTDCMRICTLRLLIWKALIVTHWSVKNTDINRGS